MEWEKEREGKTKKKRETIKLRYWARIERTQREINKRRNKEPRRKEREKRVAKQVDKTGVKRCLTTPSGGASGLLFRPMTAAAEGYGR